MTDDDFQSRASDHGRKFHDAAKVYLHIEGWMILRENWRHPDVGVEIDIVARHPVLDVEWWIECKGSWEGTRPGLVRTDTLKKALCNGALLRLVDDRRPYMIIASHPPKNQSAGALWLERAKGIYVDEVRYLGTYVVP